LAVVSGDSVRNLTAEEYEALQGVPRGYTNVPGATWSKRKKAIGNSMTTNVIRWIGERIEKVDGIVNG
jgi:DNA (cytosine-5)-methyltransferase 1